MRLQLPERHHLRWMPTIHSRIIWFHRNTPQWNRWFSMKMNKTFSIDVDLIHQLRKKRNQSQTICRALRVYFGDDDREMDVLANLTSRQLAIQLKNRTDVDGTLRQLLELWLRGDWMSFFKCPMCEHHDYKFTPAGMRVARGVSINSGIEHCRASIDCKMCGWYTCLWLVPSVVSKQWSIRAYWQSMASESIDRLETHQSCGYVTVISNKINSW